MSICFRTALRAQQRGVAAIVLLAMLGLLLVGVLLGIARGSVSNTERQMRTVQALAKAKEALIAYAVAVQPDTYAKRPGDLPCPDLNNDGHAELTCSKADQRLGRLPWKTLELPDLRDADGERLWYALSTNYQRKTTNQCKAPGDPTCLNSETPGTITVRDATGSIINDGTTPANNGSIVPTGAIAVILAPGPSLTRLGDSSPQDRSCSGDADVVGCEQSGICSSLATARCNPANYLDLANTAVVPALANAEDNKSFADASSADGFIAGPIRNAAGQIVVNDTLTAIRYVDLMPKLEQRVAREALACLRNYANGNGGHYPWAARITDDYTTALADANGLSFGRLPQTLTATESSGLGRDWPAGCPVPMAAHKDEWWANWTNLVFFAVAPAYAPGAAAANCGICLTLNPPSAFASRRVIVLVAGPPIMGQTRGLGSTALAYLEDANRDGAVTLVFKQGAASATFNDTVVYQ